MASFPTGSVDEAHNALPDENVTDPQPVIVVPFEVKPTVPVGEDPPLTVAVNVTDCPEMDGFRLETTVVVVGFTKGTVTLRMTVLAKSAR
jgi:hypothetical protein